MRTLKEVRGMVDDAVQRAARRGAERAEVHAYHNQSIHVAADRAGVAPSFSSSEGVTVRLVANGRLGVCTVPALGSIDRALDVAWSAAQSAAAARPPDFPAGGPGAEPDAWSFRDDRVDRSIALADDLMRGAFASPSVAYAAGGYRWARTEFAVANSSGLSVGDAVESERAELEVRAERAGAGRTAMDAWSARDDLLSSANPEAWARLVVDRATRALDARPLGAPAQRVILTPGPASQIVALASHAFSAASVEAGQSRLKGRAVGEMAYSNLFSLADEPQGPRGARWRRFDDEGTPTRPTRLVDAGALAGLLHDSASAQRAGVASTGNGIRKGGSGNPAPKPINLVVSDGAESLDDMIAAEQRAVLVTEPLLGAFTGNTVTGDFSVVAPFAFLVENGRIAHALPPTSLGGNAHDALRGVVRVGNDGAIYKSATTPSLVVEGISCAT